MDKRDFCQSCGMPLTPELCGTERDGGKSSEYCVYCYKNGAFTADLTMQEMIETCVPFMTAAHPDLAPAKARAMMKEVLPQLKRWRAQK